MTTNSTISQQALLLALNGHNAVAAPYFQSMRPHNIHPEIKQFFGGLPDYEQLFGNVDGAACDHDRSLFSPAAYFVDLMRLIETHVEAPEGLTLRDRRPDLFSLPLDPQNTADEKPFLQITNRILMARLFQEMKRLNESADSKFKQVEVENAWEDHYELEKLRKEMSESADSAPSQKQIEQTLFEILTYEYFPWSLPYSHAEEQIHTYLKHLGTDLAAITQSWWQTPFDALDRSHDQHIAWHDMLGLSGRRYEWLQSICHDEIYRDSESDTRYIFRSDKAVSGLSSATVPLFLAQTSLTRPQLDELIAQITGQGYMGHSTYYDLSTPGTDSLELRIDGVDEAGIEKLALGNTPLLYSFIQLARHTGWSFSDLNWALTSVIVKVTDATDYSIASLTTTSHLAKIKHVADRFQMPVDEVTCFWHDMMTSKTRPAGKYGEKDPGTIKDLFDMTSLKLISN